MKSIISVLSIVLVLAASSFSNQTSASELGSILAGICDNVASDDKSRFRKKLKEGNVKLRNIYDGISCAGKNLVRYAMENNANDVGEYIVKRLPASHFASSGDLDWAKANGFGDSKVAAAIAER